MKSFFIIPTFNKEHLIGKVIEGIHLSVSSTMPYKMIFIVDGCTDNTETILKEYIEFNGIQDKVDLLYANDIHEIRSLNMGLTHIRDNLDPNDHDLVFTVQDDVVLKEKNIDLCFKKLFDRVKNLGYISCRLGCKLHSNGDTIGESDFVESEFGHWSMMGLNNFKQIKRGQFSPCEAVIRSPTCVLWHRYRTVGFYNEDLAPCGFDCHDFSIRMNLAGYNNGVFALSYESDVDWGSTREKPATEVNSKIGQIFERNKKHLAKIYNEYFEKK